MLIRAVFAEDQGSVPSTDKVASNHPNMTPISGDLSPLMALWAPGTHGVHRQKKSKHMRIK